MNFVVPPDHIVKNKESGMGGKYLGLGREFRRLWNLRVSVIRIVIGAVETVPKSLERGLEELEIGGRIDPNYSIVEIGQNTEKCPVDLTRLVVTHIPGKDHQLTVMEKSRKKKKTKRRRNTNPKKIIRILISFKKLSL